MYLLFRKILTRKAPKVFNEFSFDLCKPKNRALNSALTNTVRSLATTINMTNEDQPMMFDWFLSLPDSSLTGKRKEENMS
jgi:hypothetical protein